MLSLLLYCLAVFVVLILYYFYKPIENNSPDSNNNNNKYPEINDQNQQETQQQQQNQIIQAINYSSLYNYDLTIQNNNEFSVNNNNCSKIVKRNGLRRVDSTNSFKRSLSTLNQNSINDNNNNNNLSSIRTDNKTNFFKDLFVRFDNLFNEYCLIYLSPFYKYLGLNYEKNQFSNEDFVNSSPEFGLAFNKNKKNQIDDKFKSLDELLTELSRLDIIQHHNYLLPNHPHQPSPHSNSTSCSSFTLNEPLNSSFNIIIGIDFTASNEWQGRKTFNSQSLHKTLGNKIYNPYQKVISVLGFVLNKLISTTTASSTNSPQHQTNSPNLSNNINGYFHHSSNTLYNSVNNLNLSNSFLNKTTVPHSILRIYAYGFGDSTTTDKNVFSFFDNVNNANRFHGIGNDLNYAESFEDVLSRYNEIVKKVNLSGPTSFAPIIYKSIEIIKQNQLNRTNLNPTNNQQHLNNPQSSLTESSPLNSYNLNHAQTSTSQTAKNSYHILFIIADGKMSNENETETIKAIVEASNYPISIIVVGVGDGPWDTMIKFDDHLCAISKFDNFQFVDYHQTIKNSKSPDYEFALKALMEIPEQIKIMKKLNYF